MIYRADTIMETDPQTLWWRYNNVVTNNASVTWEVQGSV